MIQAWDFVDYTVLWGWHRSSPRVDSIDFDGFGIGITARIRGACRVQDPPIVTLADLSRLTEYELMRWPNIGRKAVDAMRVALAQQGLSFGSRG